MPQKEVKMKTGDFIEKRKFKRLDLSLPAKVRRTSSSGKEEVHSGVTVDVSYNGAYIIDIKIKNIKPEDTLHISVSVPREDARDFPFSRLVGNATVVRVEDDGIAVEFSKDINRLFVAN